MTHELATEAQRLARDLSFSMRPGEAVDEIPLRLHSREVDAGGAPELHPAFLRYLGNASICTCGRAAVCAPNCHYNRDRVLGHLDGCEPACLPSTRFHASRHKSSPTRMKRALRTIRALNPKAYDFCFLIVARGYSFEQAAAKINESNFQRGLPERSTAEFAVLWVSGAGMLSAAY